MDSDLEKVMAHEKILVERVADESAKVQDKVEEFIRNKAALISREKEEARSESDKRKQDVIARERERQKMMIHDLENRFAVLAEDSGMSGRIRDTIIDSLFRGGGGM